MVYGAMMGNGDTVGARFAHPYVFKSLFSKEPIIFEDMVETRSVKKGVMYLEGADGAMIFVGRVGRFCPVKEGSVLYRVDGERKFAVTGTKGYQWLRAEMVEGRRDR